MSWFQRHQTPHWQSRPPQPSHNLPLRPPPRWEPAPEPPYTYGLYNEATDDSYEAALRFCAQNPVDRPKYWPPVDLDRIASQGCGAWGLEFPISTRFSGRIERNSEKGQKNIIHVATGPQCKDVCLMSDLPLMSGLYNIRGKEGFYYEVTVLKMDGVIAAGTACKPHPHWRFPGWERLSGGLHLDDCRKFFEDPMGGRDYTPDLTQIQAGDVIGCGYHFSTATMFFTHNGRRLPDAFTGIYVPREVQDVYAAIGVEGETDFEVNFGGDYFRWKEGSEWAWKIDGHAASGGENNDELPSYEEVLGGPSSS